MKQSFPLQPFPDQNSNQWQSFSLAMTLQQRDQSLTLAFDLNGAISELWLPNPGSSPSRQQNLWERTCFEIFFGPTESTEYWEVNVSPTGDWNIYHFSNYRTDMVEEERIPTLNSQAKQQDPTHFSLSTSLPLHALELASHSLDLSATAVIQKETNELSYWAISHASNQPDFHDRRSFIVQI